VKPLSVQAASEFAGALFHGLDAGYVECRALPSRARCFLPIAHLDGLADFVQAQRHENIYVGIATRRDQRSGTLENCLQLGALYADMDFKMLAERECRARLERFPFPPSLVVQTGGGFHVYWLLREALELPGEEPIARDALRRLAIALGADLSAAECARVLRVPGSFNFKYAPPPRVVTETCQPDRRYNLSELIEYLPTEEANSKPRFAMPSTASVGDRHLTLFRAGRSLKTRGLSPEAVLAALTIENQRVCVPPLTAPQVAEVVDSVFQQKDRPGYGPAPNDTPRAPAPAVAAKNVEPEGRVMTVAEAQARLGRAGEWLVHKMLAVGDMSLWVSKPGVGKSALLRQLAYAVSMGEPFLGRATTQGQVVYLALEGARATISHLILLGHNPESDQILVYIDDVDGKDPVAWLRDKLAELTPVLIIVDCLFDFARISDSANNGGYGAIYAALGPVLRYAQTQRTHVALIHHAGKRVDQASVDAALGSTGIAGKPGTVLNYRLSDPKDDASPRILSCSKHRAGDKEDLPAVVLHWDRGTKTVAVAGLAAKVALIAIGFTAVREVRRQPGIAQPALLAELPGQKQAKVSAIKALVDQRICLREGRGVRSAPFVLSLSPDVADPEARWRAYCTSIEDSGTEGPEPNSGISVPPTRFYSGTETQLQPESPVFGSEVPAHGEAPVPESTPAEKALESTPVYDLFDSRPLLGREDRGQDGMFARWLARHAGAPPCQA